MSQKHNATKLEIDSADTLVWHRWLQPLQGAMAGQRAPLDRKIITTELKAPKNQFNKFGGYKYRSAVDILEALKPHLKKYKCVLKMHDKLKVVGDYPYVQATAKLIDCEEINMQIESSAQAIIDFNAKGMQNPQRTGAASSYAKKYAIGNLFLK